MGVKFEFKKAIKKGAKARVALVGPPGSGKSLTGLILARALAGADGKIAAIDTEKGSLSKYAPGEDADGHPLPADNVTTFDFDTLPLDSFSVDNFIGAYGAAASLGYDVIQTDSLSHFWMGKDGALEYVDTSSKRSKDGMAGWKDFRPHERKMVDCMTGSPCHVIVTLRTKTEYVESVNPNTGKKQRTKIGLMPVQREGLEYEFDLVAYMDEENTFIVDKTRCPYYKKKAIVEPKAEDFAPFIEWLQGAMQDPWSYKEVESSFFGLRQILGAQRFAELLHKHAGITEIAHLTSKSQAVAAYKTLLGFARSVDPGAGKPTTTPAATASSTANAPAPADTKGPKPEATNGTVAPRNMATPAATPATTTVHPVVAAVQAVPIPAALQSLLSTLTNRPALLKAFSDLKADLVEVAGSERAEQLYSEAFVKNGKANQSSTMTAREAKQIVTDLFNSLERATQEGLSDGEDVVLSDEDAPLPDSSPKSNAEAA